MLDLCRILTEVCERSWYRSLFAPPIIAHLRGRQSKFKEERIRMCSDPNRSNEISEAGVHDEAFSVDSKK